MAASREGARMMMLAVVFFAIAHASVKFLPHIPFYQLVFLRQLIGIVICGSFLWQKGISPWGVNRQLLIWRGLVGTVALATYFYSLQHMPLASAVTIQYLSPIVTLVIAHFFLREATSKIGWLFFLFAFFGVLLVKGFDPRIAPFELSVSLVSVLFSAIAYNLVRALKDSDHELVVVFYFPLVSIPLVGPVAIYSWVWPAGWEWLFVASVGVFTFLAQFYMTRAYHRDKASDVGIYNYFGIIFALGIGYYWFDETFSVWSMIGMMLILLSVFLGTRNWPRRKTP